MEAKTLSDFVNILNLIQGVYIKENPHFKMDNQPITEKVLKYILYSDKSKYNQFHIAKKSGGKRTITAPNDIVKHIQQLTNIILQCLYVPPLSTNGFVIGRSIVDNAKPHVGKRHVYNIDLENFFPSIEYSRIKAMLHKVELPETRIVNWLRPIIYLDSESKVKLVLNESTAKYIANICCYEGALPQGAPTSPTVSNIVCKVLDYRLYKLSQKHNLVYTRYADDITFSSYRTLFTEELKKEIADIIVGQGFNLNPKKERLQSVKHVLDKSTGKEVYRKEEPQYVTGIKVNRRTNVSKSYIRNLKAALHNWKTKGYASASTRHEVYYQNEKGYLRYNGAVPKMELVIGGKIEYLKMVRGEQDTTYRLLKLRFDQLCKKENVDEVFLKEVLLLWQDDSLENAMNRFYSRQKNIS